MRPPPVLPRAHRMAAPMVPTRKVDDGVFPTIKMQPPAESKMSILYQAGVRDSSLSMRPLEEMSNVQFTRLDRYYGDTQTKLPLAKQPTIKFQPYFRKQFE